MAPILHLLNLLVCFCLAFPLLLLVIKLCRVVLLGRPASSQLPQVWPIGEIGCVSDQMVKCCTHRLCYRPRHDSMTREKASCPPRRFRRGRRSFPTRTGPMTKTATISAMMPRSPRPGCQNPFHAPVAPPQAPLTDPSSLDRRSYIRQYRHVASWQGDLCPALAGLMLNSWSNCLCRRMLELMRPNLGASVAVGVD